MKQVIVNVIDMNDNIPTFPLSQYIVQGIAETVAIGTDIIQGKNDTVIRIVSRWFSNHSPPLTPSFTPRQSTGVDTGALRHVFTHYAALSGPITGMLADTGMWQQTHSVTDRF